MKKAILFVLFLVFAIFIFNKFYITGFTTLKVDESTEFSGRNVLVKQISPDSIIVEIKGITDIISLGKYKEIAGVRVTVNEIFYVSEEEGRYTIISLHALYTYVCGDGKCEGEETKENCCSDCKCDPGYICENSECIIESKSSKHNECLDNDDCDDGDEHTIDRCEGVPKKCTYKVYYQCVGDEDCSDKNKCTEDKCINFECFNTKISGCKQEIEIKLEQPTKEGQTTSENGWKEEEKGFLSKLFSILFGWLG